MKTVKNNLIIMLCCFLFTEVALSTKGEVSIKQKMQRFSNEVKTCLVKSETVCLEKFIPQKMYFPDQDRFGCKTADTEKHWYITPREFVVCVKESEKRYSGCGKELALRDVLLECFSNKDTEMAPSGLYYKSPTGYMCHLEEAENRLYISSVTCGP